MNDAETYIGEDERRYISPTLSRDEQLGFVDTLRDVMGRNTAEINTQTERLGTDIPSNLGGLTGADSYFTQRYQTVPLESEVSALKSTAQAKALNDLLSNYESQMKNRAQQAYRRAQRRTNPSSPNNPSTDDPSTDGGSEWGEPTAYTVSQDMTMPTEGWPEGISVTGYGTINGIRYYKDAATGKDLYVDDPDFARGSDGYYYNIGQLKAEQGTIKSILNGTYWMSDQQLADRVANAGTTKTTPATTRSSAGLLPDYSLTNGTSLADNVKGTR